MGRLTDELAEHATLGIDTSPFIYQFEANPRYFSITTELLQGVRDGQWTAVVSTVTLMELTVRPWQHNEPALAERYEVALTSFPNLTLADLTLDVARQAARLRAEYRIRAADALQIGTALVHRATAFVTNNRGLIRLAPRLDIVILGDFASPSEA